MEHTMTEQAILHELVDTSEVDYSKPDYSQFVLLDYAWMTDAQADQRNDIMAREGLPFRWLPC